jgi:hypothetical protein
MASDAEGTLYVAGDCDGIWTIRTRANGAWRTVDAFVYQGHISSTAQKIAVDASGAVVVIGFAVETQTVTGLVRVSSDRGKTWRTLLEQPTRLDARFPSDLALDAEGHVLVGGNEKSPNGAMRWIARRFDPTDGSLRDAFVFEDPKLVVRGFVVKDRHVFMAAGSSTPFDNWAVVRSADGGASWQRLAPFSAHDWIVTVNQLGVAGDGALYALGAGRDKSDNYAVHWLLRRSSDDGDTWSTRETMDDEKYADPQFLAFGPDGQVFAGADTWSVVAGTRFRHWLLRSTTDEGQHWKTVSDFRASQGTYAQIRDLLVARGRAYTMGTVQQGSDHFRWTVVENLANP